MVLLLTAALFWLVTATTARTCECENVAMRGRATQSSIFYNFELGYLSNAINAIDGNLNSNFGFGSCSSTNNDYSAWWKVDLLEPHKISHIIITNRGDCCGDWLNGGEILIGNSVENNGNDNPRCAQITSTSTGTTQTFQCKGMVGQFVNIILPAKQKYLQLCEVQVFGIPTADLPVPDLEK
ncbi:fucolectin-like [Pseudophryne corroboree]|uniref:fucolectin-like n=1 Tax=Pseudophryne corroboree TaxID=495146 RepID=UPI00308185A7